LIKVSNGFASYFFRENKNHQTPRSTHKAYIAMHGQCRRNQQLLQLVPDRRATKGRHLGHLPPTEIFKTLHSIFDICRNFQIIKLKYCILIILRKVLLEFFFVVLANYLLTRYILRQAI